MIEGLISVLSLKFIEVIDSHALHAIARDGGTDHIHYGCLFGVLVLNIKWIYGIMTFAYDW